MCSTTTGDPLIVTEQLGTPIQLRTLASEQTPHCLVKTLPESFIIRENEGLVFFGQVHPWTRQTGCGGKVERSLSRKKLGASKILFRIYSKTDPCHLIGARFGNDRDLGAGCLPYSAPYVSLSILNSRTASTPAFDR